MQETAMCWGIETPDDWYDVIDTLCRALTYTYTTYLDIDKEDARHLSWTMAGQKDPHDPEIPF